ncbi:hypothetical protein ACFO0A_03095 [Novosphingobium tardum]|uniref:Cell envelope biogenesis protein TolA n=1 Tax=Novosphingobium tardum TaxID=1538021 RepID=A0ABV8RL58_9SPHN
MARKLKVFRTAVGFHDAYVAAPSRKAALAAWGTGKDLFARGAAEEVTDPTLTGAPLRQPGEVISVLRGTAADQLAALGPMPKSVPRDWASARKKPAKAQISKPRPVPPPPSRDTLDAADAALKALRDRQLGEREALRKQAAELDNQRRALARRHGQELARLEKERAAAERAFTRARKAWEKAAANK